MIAINPLFFAFLIPTMANTCFASNNECTVQSENDLHAPISLDKDIVLRFKISGESIDPQAAVFPIIIVAQQCATERETDLIELPYLGEPGEVEDAFLADANFDGKAELFVIHRATIYSDTGNHYGSDYFSTMVYERRAPLKYELSERISNYFGAGGDVFSSATSDTLLYQYPYKSKNAIQHQLNSAHYKSWLVQAPVPTRVLQKTYLYDQPNVADLTHKYLVTGDEVRVIEQNAGWLEVLFRNPKIGNIQGWIQCKDTLICAVHSQERN